MLSGLGVVVAFAELVFRVISWPGRKIMGAYVTRPDMKLVVGEVDWRGSQPSPEAEVSTVLVHVSLLNGSPNPNSVSALRLELAGKSFFPAEHHDTRDGVSMAVSGGKSAAVPRYHTWLDLPTDLKGFGSATGWVVFITMGRLTFGEASRKQGTMVAVAAAGNELRDDVPACTLPSLEKQ